MPAKADPFIQRRLLDLARIDQAVAAAEHRRRTLPELAQIADGTATVERLRGALVRGQAEIGDLDRESRKLDQEIDAVRARAKRDSDRLAAGVAPARDLENMQHELVSLARRQSTLEDEALELMERRETADAQVTQVDAELATARADLQAAEQRRDDAFADINDEIARVTAERAGLTDGMPADLLALYEQIRARGRTAAAALNGPRCEACRMDLDRSALNDIWAAGVDQVVRCTECGAILIRS
ncbi:MAG TPA: C4-type zinc ribbon domain-containing protein [Nakamurella multipartita]|nr:C4-type zinc ribbon domain-containing protein [Nakamurella multipartita]